MVFAHRSGIGTPCTSIFYLRALSPVLVGLGVFLDSSPWAGGGIQPFGHQWLDECPPHKPVNHVNLGPGREGWGGGSLDPLDDIGWTDATSWIEQPPSHPVPKKKEGQQAKKISAG